MNRIEYQAMTTTMIGQRRVSQAGVHQATRPVSRSSIQQSVAADRKDPGGFVGGDGGETGSSKSRRSCPAEACSAQESLRPPCDLPAGDLLLCPDAPPDFHDGLRSWRHKEELCRSPGR